jgi:hypothetical protein
VQSTIDHIDIDRYEYIRLNEASCRCVRSHRVCIWHHTARNFFPAFNKSKFLFPELLNESDVIVIMPMNTVDITC